MWFAELLILAKILLLILAKNLPEHPVPVKVSTERRRSFKSTAFSVSVTTGHHVDLFLLLSSSTVSSGAVTNSKK